MIAIPFDSDFPELIHPPAASYRETLCLFEDITYAGALSHVAVMNVVVGQFVRIARPKLSPGNVSVDDVARVCAISPDSNDKSQAYLNKAVRVLNGEIELF